jgi:hypothetical protein
MERRFLHVIHSNEARNEAPSSAVHQRQTSRSCGLAAVIGRHANPRLRSRTRWAWRKLGKLLERPERGAGAGAGSAQLHK